MDTLLGMKVFARVAQRSSFAAAARDLGLSPAAVTKHVAAIEARIGARLFDRTTRNVGLTEAGRIYLERCQECLQAFEDAEASVGELSTAPKGLLRVSAPLDLIDVAAVAARFMDAHPQLTVDLQMSNRTVDLVEEGIDIAVRVAAGLDGGYVARPLAISHMAIVGAPGYLARSGPLERPQDLAGHRGLVFLEPQPRDEWVLARNGEQVRVRLPGALTSNSGAALCAAVAEGAGLAVCPSFLAGPEIAAGRMERVLPEWQVLPTLGVFAIYPHRRYLAPKVRLFVEALRAAFGDPAADPWSLTGPAAPARRAPARR